MEWIKEFYPVCFFYKFTGLYCPGCGTLRAIEALAAIDFYGAFMYNPFLFIAVIPLAIYMSVIFVRRKITGRFYPSILSSPKALWPTIGIIIGIWIFRNIFPLGLAE